MEHRYEANEAMTSRQQCKKCLITQVRGKLCSGDKCETYTGLTFCSNRLLGNVEQQSEAKVAIERGIVCGAVAGTSCMRCSG